VRCCVPFFLPGGHRCQSVLRVETPVPFILQCERDNDLLVGDEHLCKACRGSLQPDYSEEPETTISVCFGAVFLSFHQTQSLRLFSCLRDRDS
jgi:hypothetical protein